MSLVKKDKIRLNSAFIVYACQFFALFVKETIYPSPLLSQVVHPIIYLRHIGDEDASLRGGIRLWVEPGNPKDTHDCRLFIPFNSFEAICKSLQSKALQMPASSSLVGFGYFDVIAKGCPKAQMLNQRIGPSSFLAMMNEIRRTSGQDFRMPSQVVAIENMVKHNARK